MLISLAAFTVLAVGLMVGASRRGDPARAEPPTPLVAPLSMPALQMRGTDGSVVDLRQASRDKVTLVYFGYLNCPDACPITMGVLASLMPTLPTEVLADLQVWFVGTDLARDTPAEIAEYLEGFDRSFVGLTGTEAQIRDFQSAAGVPIATPEQPDPDGSYLVGHATSVYVYGRDGTLIESLPFGTRRADWERILPELVAA